MKKKISTPVAVTITVIAVILAVIFVFRTVENPSGDTGDIKDLAKQVVNASPKNAPKLPPGIDPTKGAIGMGGKKKS